MLTTGTITALNTVTIAERGRYHLPGRSLSRCADLYLVTPVLLSWADPPPLNTHTLLLLPAARRGLPYLQIVQVLTRQYLHSPVLYTTGLRPNYLRMLSTVLNKDPIKNISRCLHSQRGPAECNIPK